MLAVLGEGFAYIKLGSVTLCLTIGKHLEENAQEATMNRLIFPLSAALLIVTLNGCASSPYYEDTYVYEDGYYPSSDGCRSCGEIRDIERVHRRGSNSGGGALLGAIIGGALGNTVGKGDGRTAATIAGAVAGGFAGNAVENHNADERTLWRFHVRLDDGRWAVVTQYDNPGLHRGDRVSVNGDHVTRVR